MSLKSYKVVTHEGELLMVIVVNDNFNLKTWNNLFQNGMKVVVLDERSQMVNKNFVDKE